MINFISINFTYIRKENHLSQAEIGLKVGATSHSVSAYERSKALPGIEIIQKLCAEFNLLIDDFVNKDLSKIEKRDDFVKELEQPYHIIDRKTEAMYDKIITNYEKQLELKDLLIEEKSKTNKVLQKQALMLEVIINQNAINTNTPLTDRLAGILKIENEIAAAKKEQQKTTP